MFRFSIRELMLVTLVVAVAAGWWLDKGNSDAKYTQLSSKFVPIEEQMRLIDTAVRKKLDAAKDAGL